MAHLALTISDNVVIQLSEILYFRALDPEEVSSQYRTMVRFKDSATLQLRTSFADFLEAFLTAAMAADMMPFEDLGPAVKSALAKLAEGMPVVISDV